MNSNPVSQRHKFTEGAWPVVVIAIFDLLVLSGCSLQDMWYQVDKIVPLSASLKGKDVVSEIFKRPPPGTEEAGSITASVYSLANEKYPNFAREVAKLDTARISNDRIAVDHMFSYAQGWCCCLTVWSIENRTDHDLRLDTEKCRMFAPGMDKKLSRPIRVSQHLGEETTRIPIADIDTLLAPEKQPAAKVNWPVLTLPANSTCSIGFTYESTRSKRPRFRIYIEDASDHQTYECEFRMSRRML